MRVVLSRKGFDSINGGIPSPIMPDGALLSLPIPEKEPSDDMPSFGELEYNGRTYDAILQQLCSRRMYEKRRYSKCHLDPDIREGVRKVSMPDWKPAFGQIDAAQGHLTNNKIGAGDLFLFFGRFRKTYERADGKLSFEKGSPILHIIYGYMEVGEVVTYDMIEEKGYTWHPHCSPEWLKNKTNTLYLPSENLSFDDSRPGWGVFDYSEKLTLTSGDRTATWREIPALMPYNITSDRKNDAIGSGIYYKGIWQEMVLKDNALSAEWAKGLF